MRRTAVFLVVPVLVSALLSSLPAAGPPAGAAPDGSDEPRFQALVFSKTNGFRHESIPAGNAAIEQLGAEHDFAVTVTEDASVFTDEQLAAYDVVVFNNTNSRNGPILDAEQRAAFERYVEAGGGYAGIHNASGTGYDWPWYGRLVGAYLESHPEIQEVEIEVDDPVHPSTADLPQEWTWTEEPYDFAANPRGDVHVLASLDVASYEGHTMGADHPIAWCQDVEDGRSWYTALGHEAAAYSEPLFLQHLLGGIEWAAGAAPGDCGATDEDRFEKVLLDGNTDDPLDIAVADDGRVFSVERGGAVKMYDPTDQHTDQIAFLDVLVEHTHGMHGITLDPAFAENNHLYIYYSPLEGTVNRVSRFTYQPDTETIDLDSEQVLLEIGSQRQVSAHEGGGMDFDAAGNLYIATGDNTAPCCSGFGATDERPGEKFNDAQRSAANTNDLRGKILRIHPEPDGTYTIPDGNLFPPGTEKTRPEIYVMGVRNPYRIHVDQETGFLHWGDVGPDARADSAARGPQGYDEFNIATEAGNFGWPHCIADNQAYVDYDYATGESNGRYDCAGGPVNDSPNNTGLTQLPPAQPAWIAYPYDESPDWPELGTGGRLALQGPRYHYDPDLDSETKFPEYFDGTDIVAEWTRNTVFEVKSDAEGAPAIINQLWPSGTFKRPIDFEFGPDGSLYLAEWGTNYGGSGRGDPNDDSGIYKINYVRPGERSPVAMAQATPTSGQPPLTVQFDSAGSYDPDEGDTITVAWDFDGDGTTDSTDPAPTHVYADTGDVAARLTVTDSTGRTGIRNVPITVGNTAPVVEMVRPLDGQVFTFGDPIPFQLDISDAEDGTAEDGGIDCGTVVTQPRLGHDEHGHPLNLYHGCAGTIRSIVDEGHDANDNTFYIVDSTYTDNGGDGVKQLTGGDSAILQPRLKQAEHFTSSDGVEVIATNEPDGGRMLSQIDHGDYVSFEPVNLAGVTELRFRVAAGETGGTIEVRTGSVDGPVLATVDVESGGDGQRFRTHTVEVSDPGGSHELFLVFTDTPGAESLFSLDWVRFSTPLVEPLGVAYRHLGRFDTVIEDNAAELTEEQRTYLADLSGRITENLLAAWPADPASETFTDGADNVLKFSSDGQRWIDRQLADGALPQQVATALAGPLQEVQAAASQTAARLRQASVTTTSEVSSAVGGQTVRVTTTLSNNGDTALRAAALALTVPDGWTAEAVGPVTAKQVEPGTSFAASWDVTVPDDTPFGTVRFTGSASYRHAGTADATIADPLDFEIRPPFEHEVPLADITATASSYQSGYEPELAIDGDTVTMWHTSWDPYDAPPQSLTLDLGSSYPVSALRYVPRQDGNPNGHIPEFRVWVSADGQDFHEAAAGTWAADGTVKYASWPAESARYVRLEAVDGSNGYVAAAEVAVAYAE